MRIMLASAYELGRQPVHLASPAGALERAGHAVVTVDMAIDELTGDLIDGVDAVAISVPMHTATRLALKLADEVKRRRPEIPIALYGLYAGVPDAGEHASMDVFFEGEYEPALLRWASSQSGDQPGLVSHTGKSSFTLPQRSGLPELGRYARLEYGGRSLLAGAVEASHGCRHRCRHCPIPAVYDGRMRIVPKDIVLSDIDQLVEAGAQHITFGDADFLNAPRHSLDVLSAASAAHPEITFDATIKVEHILQHRDLWPHLADMNLLFVVSAFESVDDETLDILDKGHDVSDMAEAVELVRSSGVYIRPTWLPFLPWTTPVDVAETFRFIAEHDLTGATDPVQMSIRLLVPRGSLLEDHPALGSHLTRYDSSALTWLWEFGDPEAAVLHKELEVIAANASDCGQDAAQTLEEMRAAVVRATGRDLPAFTDSDPAPRLSESWFCCAEPTEGQSVAIRIGQPG